MLTPLQAQIMDTHLTWLLPGVRGVRLRLTLMTKEARPCRPAGSVEIVSHNKEEPKWTEDSS